MFAGALVRKNVLLTIHFICFIFLIVGHSSAEGAKPDKRIVIRAFGLWPALTFGTTPDDPIIQLMKEHPHIQVEEWMELTVPGAQPRIALTMAMAADSPPELLLSNFHIIRNDVSQGFLYPLNEWIGEDEDGNGQVDLDEAKWPGWKKTPEFYRRVATVDGKIYGVMATTDTMGILFRVDLVRRAGLDPDNPPETWDEFIYWCQRLTDSKRKIRGFGVTCYAYTWWQWLLSAGGYPGGIAQVKTSPTTGKRYTFPMDATKFLAPDTGEDLTEVPSEWRAALADAAGQRAVAFYHRLRWQRWIRDPKTGEPINLNKEQVKSGRVRLPNQRTVTFDPEDVITGMIMTHGSSGDEKGDWEALAYGDIAMCQGVINDPLWQQQFVGMDPELLGGFPLPAGPNGHSVLRRQAHFGAMAYTLGRRSKAERNAAWKVLTTLCSDEFRDKSVRDLVLSGRAGFVDPKDLKRLGFEDYISEVSPSIMAMYADLDEGKILTHTQPFMGSSIPIGEALRANVLSLVLSENGEGFDYVKALKDVERMANTGAMFTRSAEEMDRYRGPAKVIFAAVLAIVLFFVVRIVKANLTAQTRTVSARAGVHKSWIPWLMLAPAFALIAMWGYYPLVRGLFMSFQDYSIVGSKPWVGLDNFITIFLNPDFYIYVRQTIKFVFMNMAMVFSAPILLALLLSEIPRGKLFFRWLFMLPQITSPIVIALLWRLIYQPADRGLLNRVLQSFGLPAHDWLGDPATAMLATVIPTVWAATGISSLIYLAALKCIPSEMYEAAELDGAGILGKLRFVTIPQLLPLIIILFIGAFIGSFQGMGNIFLLTFGGPGKETMVLSMAIWLEAYNNLRFSIATSMAWVMGSCLIGFAYLQIRMLGKVEFRRVEEI